MGSGQPRGGQECLGHSSVVTVLGDGDASRPGLRQVPTDPDGSGPPAKAGDPQGSLTHRASATRPRVRVLLLGGLFLLPAG